MSLFNAEQSMFSKLRDSLAEMRRDIDSVSRREVSQVAISYPRYTVADLPTASAAREAWVAFATNGRKSGEGVGTGTGVVVVCANDGTGTYQWLRQTDLTQVVA